MISSDKCEALTCLQNVTPGQHSNEIAGIYRYYSSLKRSV